MARAYETLLAFKTSRLEVRFADHMISALPTAPAHRRHSALDYESPISYEKKHRLAA
jgi:hypothetical protein